MKCYNERKTDDMDLPGNMAINVNNSSNVNATQSSSNTIALNQNSTNNTNIDNEANIESKIVQLDECLICSDLKRDTIFKVKFQI